jgi:hypothetical protein
MAISFALHDLYVAPPGLDWMVMLPVCQVNYAEVSACWNGMILIDANDMLDQRQRARIILPTATRGDTTLMSYGVMLATKTLTSRRTTQLHNERNSAIYLQQK